MMTVSKLDLSLRETHLDEDFKLIIREIQPEWMDDKLKYRMFTGGLSNKLLGAYHDDKKDEMILIRIHGAKSELIIDRQGENKILKLLHAYHIGPELYAEFNNGIAYQYIPGIELTTESCRSPQIYPLVCDTMARLHSVPTDDAGSCFLWNQIQRFISHMSVEYLQESSIHEAFFSKDKLESELGYLKDLLGNLDVPLVYSHNDMIMGNLIHDEKHNKIKLIDFEYCGLNYQPFDVANHFAEYAGVESVNYDLFPDKEYQLIWIREYLEKFHKYTKHGSSVTEDEVNDFYSHTQKFVLASHFIWTTWALFQAKESNLQFDYFEYATIRMKEYKRRKQMLTN